VNEGGAFLVYLLEVDDELTWIVLGVCEDFRAEQCDDVIRNDTELFVLEIGVVDTKIGVKPLNLPGNELPGNEALKTNPMMSVPGTRVSKRWLPWLQRCARQGRVVLLCP